MFGAFFGLGVAYALGKPASSDSAEEEAESSNVSDLFSLIGTLFLWIYWPSFVAGPLVADAATQQRAVVNTVLALSASTMMAFAVSVFFSTKNKFRPVDIQNATLAGKNKLFFFLVELFVLNSAILLFRWCLYRLCGVSVPKRGRCDSDRNDRWDCLCYWF